MSTRSTVSTPKLARHGWTLDLDRPAVHGDLARGGLLGTRQGLDQRALTRAAVADHTGDRTVRVAEASLGSVKTLPVNCIRNQSLGCSAHLIDDVTSR
jgi:hypothetical protein